LQKNTFLTEASFVLELFKKRYKEIFMKATYAFVCGLMAIFAQGHSDQHIYSEVKFYLSPETVEINQEGIFVHLENAQYKINDLYSDAAGIYTSVRQPVNSWKCSKGHPNPPWSDKCATCPERR
jgi:hypothetical protein